MGFLENDNVIEINTKVKGIPAIILRPKNVAGKIPTIIFYHGWSSSKDSQKFRGYILASYGFQVLLPDGLYHGDRGNLKYNALNASKYFWEIIFNNLEESKELIEHLVEHYEADPKRLGVTGHSMGAITASGVFTKNSRVSTLVTMNGSCNWKEINEMISQGFNSENWHKDELMTLIEKYDPNNFHEKLINRPVLLLHGEADVLVSPKPDREFIDTIRPKYEDKNKIDIIEFPRLGHFVTTNMLEEALIWFKKYL